MAELPADDLLAAVTAEIDEEVRRRRRDGDLPAGFEAEMDRLYRALLPPAAPSGPVREALAAVDAAGYDEHTPLGSRLPAGAAVKRAVDRLVGWYVRYHTAQLARGQWAAARALHTLADEVEALRPSLAAEAGWPTAADGPDRWWLDLALDALRGAAPGRVLHWACGSGGLLDALADAGLDAYGVDGSADAVTAAVARGRDARTDGLAEHLETVAPGSLAGVVLDGPVQWLGPGQRDRVLDRLPDALAPGGVLVLASATPAAWARTAPPAVADLAPGCPLHPETWVSLLGEADLEVRAVHRGGPDRRVAVGPGAPAAVAQLAEVVNALVGGPDGYVVVAGRSR